MNQRNPVIGGRELVDMRLMALLRELERDHGRRKAAAILGVDRRTLDAGLDDGVLSRRMRGALDRALLSRAWALPQPSSGTVTTSWRRGSRGLRRSMTNWPRSCAGVLPSSSGGSRTCGGTLPRGPGPVTPGPVPPRRKPVRRTVE